MKYNNMVYFIIAVLLVIGALIYILQDAKNQIAELHKKLEEKEAAHIVEKAKVHENSKFRSAAANWGFTIENFVPFIDTFPIPSEDVNFLGKPIDFVGFTNTSSTAKCEVHFIEVKSGSAFLSQKQKNIKKAIQEGRVKWHEVRVGGNKPVK